MMISTDSVAALSLAVVLSASVLVSQCLAAPVTKTNELVELKQEQWKYPCDKKPPKKMLPPHQPKRHPPKELRRIMLMLKNAQLNFKKARKNIIQSLYKGMEKSNFHYSYDWLPEKNMKWYEQVQHLSDRERISKVLPRFYQALQNYSVTFAAMRLYAEADIPDELFHEKRTELLDSITQRHKSVLCETWSALYELGIELPEDATIAILPENKWHVKPNHSTLRVRDWGVIKKYQIFLMEWTKVMKRLLKPAPQARHKHKSAS